MNVFLSCNNNDTDRFREIEVTKKCVYNRKHSA